MHILNIVAQELEKISKSIQEGNSELTEEECISILEMIKTISDKTNYVSKYEAYTKYLRVSKSTFEGYIRKGLLPPGIHRPGFKEKAWKVKDLEDFIKNRRKTNGDSKKTTCSNI